MIDYTKQVPDHIEKYIGENHLFLEIFEGRNTENRPPLLFVHGAYTGSWMWSKFIPHFVEKGWNCYVMNLRSHYKSRLLDMTRITLEDYMEDIREIMKECAVPPILIGFSMGGILTQKLAETTEIAGMVLIDSVLSKEVHDKAPYKELGKAIHEIIVPAPAREEFSSIDETTEDIEFQRKYLTMESAHAVRSFSFTSESNGVSIDSHSITCPSLVIKAVNNELDDHQGRLTADHLSAEYLGLWNTTHTGVLIGQRYMDTVHAILNWLKSF
ncbi:alpha/beta fold hydrolase [Radiobacillus deserti]|uniref:Alpha/beta hydrolase n=1 Tax=Radiobacillus deserti TaxID=2594883 RepID=A0A516KKM9_9BACI|nr:alpha/beta fold hydrolase [Radiobacillus deserti]QDP41950.1 alpha/beta hydrolase [Radiobacillus deserti]